jgi:hypothetical protein
MTPHPDTSRLIRALSRCGGDAVEWSGVVYRSTDLPGE